MIGGIVLLCAIASAETATVAERVARGHVSFDALEYEAAVLEFALAAEDPRATPDQKIEANLYAGIANRVLGRDVEARLNFAYVLKRRPDTVLPASTPLKIVSFFSLVKDELRRDDDVGMAPPPSPTSSSVVAEPPPATSPAAVGSFGMPVLLGGIGVFLAGGVMSAVGIMPALAHEDAAGELAQLAAAGGDGTAAQAKQQRARADWESWGAASAAVGVAVGLAGLVATGVGAALLGGE